jgi:hypothetical protein
LDVCQVKVDGGEDGCGGKMGTAGMKQQQRTYESYIMSKILVM